MTRETRTKKVLKIRGGNRIREPDLIVREAPVAIILDDEHLVTLLCTPADLEHLAAGFLLTQGIVKGRDDIGRVYADVREGAVWVESASPDRPLEKVLKERFVTSGCGRGLSFVDPGKASTSVKEVPGPEVTPALVASLMKEFQERSRLYRMTGGVHSAGLADAGGILAFSEDIGRHNAVDKVLGESLLKGIDTEGLILLTSGRVSSDVLVKAAVGRIPIVLSRAAPSDLSIKLAADLGITLVGFVRGSRMNVYSNEWRITGAPTGKKGRTKRQGRG